MSPYTGEIRLMSFGFAPQTWMACNGQELQVSMQRRLFNVIGNKFGGDGRTTFAVPNLKAARIAVGAGAGPGLTPRSMGESGGAFEVALSTATTPPHTHRVNAVGELADVTVPSAETALARTNGATPYGPPTNLVPLDPATVTPAPGGDGRPHNNQMPYLALYYCICYEGIDPVPAEEG